MIIDQTSFQHLVPGVSGKGGESNRICMSEYYNHYSINNGTNFNIKFPLKGNIHFKTDGGEFELCPGYYFLSYQQKGAMFIDSKIPVRFISIDIQPQTMYEAFDRLSTNGGNAPKGLQPDDLFSDYFIEHIYPIEGSDLGKTLAKLGKALMAKGAERTSINEVSFSNLAEKIVLSGLVNYKYIRNLNSIKTTTKKETLKRLLMGKHYIDEHYSRNPEVAEIAKACSLSGFHFLRSFKQAFSLSPYQYMLQKRLQ